VSHFDHDEPLVGVIEAGGTWMRCGVGRRVEDFVAAELAQFPTTNAAESMRRALAWIGDAASGKAPVAVGVASFGPLDLAAGSVARTPKAGWRAASWRDRVKEAFPGAVLALATDVGAAAVGELHHGALAGTEVGVYMTVGTGIGAGIVVRGRLLQGRGHPEVGHVLVAREAGDTFPGCCPFHRDCLEGLASGEAISKRFGRPAAELPDDHVAWDLEARYLGGAIANLQLTVSPERIVIGGGVLSRRDLRGHIRAIARERLGDYLEWPAFGLELVDPVLGRASAVVGAFHLAREALDAVGHD